MTDKMVREDMVFHTEEECKEMYRQIPQEKKEPALAHLRQALAKPAEEIRAAIKRDPETWWASYHFRWGMAVRNDLRRNGFGEDYFGVHNLDDIYAQLVEEALAT